MESKKLIIESNKVVNANKFILSLYNSLTKETMNAKSEVINKESAKFYKTLKTKFNKNLQSISLLGLLDMETAISLYNNNLKYSAVTVAKLSISFDELETAQHENVFERATKLNELMKLRLTDNSNRNSEFLNLLDFFGGFTKLKKSSSLLKIVLKFAPQLIQQNLESVFEFFEITVKGDKISGLEALKLILNKDYDLSIETFKGANFNGLSMSAYKSANVAPTAKEIEVYNKVNAILAKQSETAKISDFINESEIELSEAV